MGINQVSNANLHAAQAPEANATAATLAAGLPAGALHSQQLQPLFASLDPSQVYPFTPAPLPFAKPESFSQFTTQPGLLVNSLQTAATGLGGFLQSLDVNGADKQIAQHMANAQAAFEAGDMLTAQLEMMEAQKLQTFMSTLINMIGSMEMEAIRNSKLS